MCCLFGILNYGGCLSLWEKNKLLSNLAAACEARGVDATGIAYNSSDRLRIYKRPFPAHWMRFRVPEDVSIIMGHTRMTTQGSERHNYNNHPFYGRVGDTTFALAHNGILHNDKELRKAENLPSTNVETDSFIAVQLLEQFDELTANSLGHMAEKLRGSFTITVLDSQDHLWFVKGDNPLCLYHFAEQGLYVYASTQEILKRGLQRTPLHKAKPEIIPLSCGEILRIDRHGVRLRETFTFTPYNSVWSSPWDNDCYGWNAKESVNADLYLDEIKSVASAFGITCSQIDHLAAEGFAPEEIEEWLYYGQFRRS